MMFKDLNLLPKARKKTSISKRLDKLYQKVVSAVHEAVETISNLFQTWGKC